MRHIVSRVQTIITYTGAVLLLLCSILPIVLLDSVDIPISWISSGVWPLLSIMAFILAALLPFIILALYTYQIEELGRLGLVGLVITLVGLLLYLGFQFDLAFVWPVLATRAPELLDFSGPMFRDPRFAFVHLWMGPVHIIGMILFGIALIRARVFPRTASAILMVGLILSAGILFPPLILRTVGGISAAAALGWIGSIMWQRRERESAAT